MPRSQPAVLRSLLEPFRSQEPAAQLIRQTARQQARQQWRLIALNLGSSLVEAFSEGARGRSLQLEHQAAAGGLAGGDQLARRPAGHHAVSQPAGAGGGAGWGGFQRLGGTRIGFPLSRKDPPPEQTTQPPPANQVPPAPALSRAAAPTPSRDYLAASQRWQP